MSDRSGPGDADGAAGALFTDLYELTMAQAYRAGGQEGPAVFEAFFRHLPRDRGYMVAAGLDDVLTWLAGFRFREAELAWLADTGFPPDFLGFLRDLRFTGDVWAVPEGTVVFPEVPLLQVEAPLIQGQLVETYLLNQLHLQTVLASKASRVVDAAAGRPVVDFGARRAHGTDAALKAARVAWMAGAAGTSNLEAARRYGLPAFGTMAHSFVQIFDDEAEAFEAFARVHPGTTLLVDTYDTLVGIDRVIGLMTRREAPIRVEAIRLDSGDLEGLAREARRRLDAAGLDRVRILASSELDEGQIAGMVARGAPIDGFGVGTRMVVSLDAPDVDLAYKLVAYAGKGRVKLSTSKVTHPCRKQVFRTWEGPDRGDRIARWDEACEGEPLLVKVMEGGRRLPAGRETLAAARDRLEGQRARLPSGLRRPVPEGGWPVRHSPRLEAALDGLRGTVGASPATDP